VAVMSLEQTRLHPPREEHRSRSYPLSQARGFRTAHLHPYLQGRPFLVWALPCDSRRRLGAPLPIPKQNAAVEFREVYTCEDFRPYFCFKNYRARPSSWQRKGKQSRSRRNSHVLLSIDRETHRRRIHRCSALKVPQRFTGSSLQRYEVPFRITREHQSARR